MRQRRPRHPVCRRTSMLPASCATPKCISCACRRPGMRAISPISASSRRRKYLPKSKCRSRSAKAKATVPKSPISTPNCSGWKIRRTDTSRACISRAAFAKRRTPCWSRSSKYGIYGKRKPAAPVGCSPASSRCIELRFARRRARDRASPFCFRPFAPSWRSLHVHVQQLEECQVSDSERFNDRRGFLQGAAAAAAGYGITQWVSAASAADTPPAAPQATDFQRWLESIPGKHRQVYDAPEPNGGFALITAWVFLLTAQQGYAVTESDLGVVVVLRHNAIPIALNDSLWTKYKLGELFKIDDPATKAPALRNPFANIKAGDLPLPDMALDKLSARGVKFG